MHEKHHNMVVYFNFGKIQPSGYHPVSSSVPLHAIELDISEYQSRVDNNIRQWPISFQAPEGQKLDLDLEIWMVDLSRASFVLY